MEERETETESKNLPGMNHDWLLFIDSTSIRVGNRYWFHHHSNHRFVLSCKFVCDLNMKLTSSSHSICTIPFNAIQCMAIDSVKSHRVKENTKKNKNMKQIKEISQKKVAVSNRDKQTIRSLKIMKNLCARCFVISEFIFFSSLASSFVPSPCCRIS